MADVFSKETRSRIMSTIRGKDTKPEVKLRKELSRLGYRYSLKHRFYPLNFKPDIVLVSKKVCIFVDGCFWHRCPKCYNPPKSNRGYWIPKINRNVKRDKQQNDFLKKHGWKVIRIWEHEINNNLKKALAKVQNKIK